MSRYLSALFSCLVACAAFAQDEAAGGPPSETVSMVWVVVFGVIFIGMIVGFLAYMWWNERQPKKDD